MTEVINFEKSSLMLMKKFVLGTTQKWRLIWSEVQHSISSVLLYYGTQSDIRLKIYCGLIGSKLKHSISNLSIYYGTQSNIRKKSYCRLNWPIGSTLNFKRLDILRDLIRNSSKKLLSFDLAQSFNIQVRASRYMTILNQKSE